MTLPVYPQGDMARPQSMLAAVGTMWAEQFEGRGVLLAMFRARQLLYEGVYTEYLETAATLSQNEIPVYHTEPWVPIVLVESEMEVVPAQPLTYAADQAHYGEPGDNPPYDQEFQYGDGLTTAYFYRFPLPAACKSLAVLTEGITHNSHTWVSGTDYYVDLTTQTLTLRVNPFTQTGVLVTNVLDADVNADREALLFGFQCEFDWDYLYVHYGYVLGLDLDSSPGYQALIQSVWGAHVHGPTVGSLLSALSAVYDVPLAVSDEVVTAVLDGEKFQVITDKQVYTYPAGSTAMVAVGDAVKQYAPLVTTLKPMALSGALPIRGYAIAVGVPEALRATTYAAAQREVQHYADHDYLYATQGLSMFVANMAARGTPLTPTISTLLQDYASLPGLGVGSALLAHAYVGDLVFPNVWQRITAPDLDAYGNGLQFTVQGFDEDVTRYWQDVETTGQQELSLALRLWVAQGGSEAALATPALKAEAVAACARMDIWINPMYFMLWNVLATNMFVVKVLHAYTGNNQLLASALTQMRKTLLPTTSYLAFIEMQIPEEVVNIGEIWSEEVFASTGPVVDESIELAIIEDTPAAGIIEGVPEE